MKTRVTIMGWNAATLFHGNKIMNQFSADDVDFVVFGYNIDDVYEVTERLTHAEDNFEVAHVKDGDDILIITVIHHS